MDDIERELRQVQLQRERSALERELARKSALQWIRKVARTVSQLAAGAAKHMFLVLRFFARQWKLLLVPAVATASAVGAIAWNEKLRLQRYETEEAAFVSKKCEQPGASRSCRSPGASAQDQFLCMQARQEEMICRLGASAEFGRMHGR